MHGYEIYENQSASNVNFDINVLTKINFVQFKVLDFQFGMDFSIETGVLVSDG